MTTTRARPPRASSPRRVPTRRRALVRRSVAIGVVLAIIGLVVVLFATPLISVRAVDVTGVSRLPIDQVRKQANVPIGTSMLDVDTSAIATRVAALTPVSAVTVSRSWPGTIDIAVTERKQLVWNRAANGAVQLVDDQGVAFASAPAPPHGVAELRISPLQAGDLKVTAALAVLSQLSPQLRARTVAIGANSPGDVRVFLANGKSVNWGDATDSARKNQVIVALLTRPGSVFDVATPDMPTVR